MKYILITLLLTFVISFRALADQQQDPQLTLDMLNKYSLITPQVLANRHFWTELAIVSDMGLGEAGIQAGVGYRLGFFGFDLRFSKGTTTYGKLNSLAAKQSTTDTSEYYELYIPRNKSDSWSYQTIEPGFSVADRFFAGMLPQFTERARVGIVFGDYTDTVNNIPFNSYILNVETSLIYQLNPQESWSVCGSLNWNTGMLVRFYDNTQSYGIPASWVGSSISMIYTF